MGNAKKPKLAHHFEKCVFTAAGKDVFHKAGISICWGFVDSKRTMYFTEYDGSLESLQKDANPLLSGDDDTNQINRIKCARDVFKAYKNILKHGYYHGDISCGEPDADYVNSINLGNILYKREGDTLQFALHDFGMAKAFDQMSGKGLVAVDFPEQCAQNDLNRLIQLFKGNKGEFKELIAGPKDEWTEIRQDPLLPDYTINTIQGCLWDAEPKTDDDLYTGGFEADKITGATTLKAQC